MEYVKIQTVAHGFYFKLAFPSWYDGVMLDTYGDKN